MTVPVITDKYIIIRVAGPEQFDQDSFRTLWVDKDNGIQEIMGKHLKHESTEVQAYVFDKNRYTIEEAKQWVKEKYEQKKETQAELFVGKKAFVTANMTLCTSKPNLAVGAVEGLTMTPDSYAKMQAQAALNDRYYFYVEGVHEGMNGNGDFFSQEELTQNYKSATHQLIDWEHARDQIIGFSLDSELLSRPEEPVALAFTGVLNRLSPHMQAEERYDEDKIAKRDDLIRQRYFEGKLAVSMECYFDSMKCMECGYETADPLDFEFHKMLTHKSMIEAGEKVPRGLIGVDFVGWGVVGQPADREAFVPSLRTSDDGTIEDILVSSEEKKRYGCFAENIAFANMVAKTDPTDTFWGTLVLADESVQRYVFASDMMKTNIDSTVANKNRTDSTKTKNKNDKRLEKSSKGGFEMFNLSEKITSSTNINDALVIAMRTLKDFQGDKPLQAEEVEAFAAEFAEAVKPLLNQANFRISEIYTLTDADKLTAIEAAREEEKARAATELAELQTKFDNLEVTKVELEATVSSKDEEINTLKNAEADRVKANKVDTFIKEVKEAGVELTETFEADVRTLAEAKLDDEDALKSLKGDIVASVKRSVLANASDLMGANSAGSGGNDATSLSAKLDKAQEDSSKG